MSAVLERQIASMISAWEGSGILSSLQVERAKRAAEASGERIDRVLNRLGLVNDEQLVAAYLDVTQLKIIETEPEQIQPFLPEGISASFLKGTGLVPIQGDREDIDVLIGDPLDLRPLEALTIRLKATVRPWIAAPKTLKSLLARLPSEGSSGNSLVPLTADLGRDDLARLRDMASEAPVIRFVSDMIEAAVERSVTDIHVTSTSNGGRVRFRVDGVLEEFQNILPHIHQAVISRLKIMAALDIGESRVPQDGRIQSIIRGRPLDLRISTMPHMNGEGAFIRLLEHRADRLDLVQLGFGPDHLECLRGIISHANGLFLVTGPTGSGKTTTLYAVLRELNHPGRNIVTVEDPIEYRIEGVNQIQINRQAGLDFPKALRSVLRQDPDIILVGEIRDHETAAIAVQAALTGHFVLATLHTNDAATVVDRLVDMGIEPFLLGAVLRGAMAQRLVRQCVEGGARFKGRIPVSEIVAITPEMRDLLSEGGRSSDLKRLMVQNHVPSLTDDAERLVAVGATTRAEILLALGD